METAAILAAIAFAVLVVYLVQALREVQSTLRAYRSLEPKVVALLDNSRRVMANVEEITRQVTVQSARVDRMTSDAQEMVDQIRRTVDVYNRTLARPAVMAAGMAKAVSAAANVLFRRGDD